MDPNVPEPQQPIPSQPVQQQVSQQTKKSFSFPKILLSVLGVLVVLGLISGAYYLGLYSNKIVVKPQQETTIPHISVSPAESSSSSFLSNFPYAIPFTSTQAQWENYLDMNLLVGSVVQIPQTDLQLTIPATFDNYSNSKDTNINLVPSLTFIRSTPKIIYDIQQCRILENVTPHNVQSYITQNYCQPLLAKFGKYFEDIQPGISDGDEFAISVVSTDQSPQNWIKGNIKPQGSIIPDSNIQSIQVNGFTFYSVQAGCCTEYDLVYVFPYANMQGQKLLIIFNTNNSAGSTDPQRSTILDRILSSLKKKV